MASYNADDETISVFSAIGDEVEETGGGEVTEGLIEEIVSAQRLAVTRLLRKHVGGRMEIPAVIGTGKSSPEKRFNVGRVIDWYDGEPEELLDALSRGRVRTRLSAAMGTGKTVKLAPLIASRLDKRVLFVSLDSIAMQRAMNYGRSIGMCGTHRHWGDSPGARLCYMTYADFVSHGAARTRSEMFKRFDVFVFDEAFVAADDVFAAKRIFAAYATPEVSLVLCSATIRTDMGGDAAKSRAMGEFRELNGDLSVADAIKSGKLVSDYLVDRTLVVVPTDMDLADLEEHYLDYGVDVACLPSAIAPSDVVDVEEWLRGDAVTPRVLVAHSDAAIGYNFAVSYAIIWPQRGVVKEVNGVWTTTTVPMTSEMVSQAKARTGRGIADGSGGVIMGPTRAPTEELYPDACLSAFVKLRAADIVPGRDARWDQAKALFPDGLPSDVAKVLLKLTLPIEIAVRYLGSDGRFAGRYCRALNAFAHPDHYLLASRDDLPVDYDSWYTVSAPHGHEEQYATVKVPVHAEGELGVVVYGVSAIADGLVSIERWRPRITIMDIEDYRSDDESYYSHETPQRRLRRVNDDVPVIDTVTIATAPSVYSYNREHDPGFPRVGRFLDPERTREALRVMNESLLNYRPRNVVAGLPRVEAETGEALVVDAAYGSVESPGGSEVCKLPVAVCHTLNEGHVLAARDMEEVVVGAKPAIERFVASKLFDALSGPWDSILNTLLDRDVVRRLVRDGLASDAYALVDCLRTRFNKELGTVLAKSNVFKKKWMGLFKKTPSMDRLMRAVNEGRFDMVAQTRRYIERVKQVKRLMDEVALLAESHNVFLPAHVTRAQRALPLRGQALLGTRGADLAALPPAASEAIEAMAQDSRLRSRFKPLEAPSGW